MVQNITNNITTLTNAMFLYRKQWPLISDDIKEKWFFILNRYLSKLYPEQAQMLNDKSIDKITATNIWYAFMLDKPYPNVMWSKAEEVLPDKDAPSKEDEKKVKKILFSQKDLLNLQKEIQITDSELEVLVMYHEEELKDELKYIKKQQNE
jgi:pyruvate dehydrogenase complex dehydrogenase (E1) component